jgi:Domain of unknown function (DUF4388)
MALHGTIETFPLSDVLRLLSVTRQSGCLQLHADASHGNVWMGDGAVLTADSDHARDAPTDEALADLFRWPAGAFAFRPDELPRSNGQSHDTEALIASAERLAEEWEALQATVPSQDHTVALAATLPGNDVVIDAERWTWLAAVSGGRTVCDLAVALDLTELGVLRVVATLVELGVVTVTDPFATGD